MDAVEHTCFRNWSGSSGAMEASIIVEGFKQSQIMHGLKYLQFIGDGDSSVYAKIRSEVSYGSDVSKIECRNHTVKNFGKALYKVKGDSRVSAEARKLLTANKIKELQDFCIRAIFSNAHNMDVESLKKDLQNGPYHVFGIHTNCSEQYCSSVGCTDGEKKAESSGLMLHVQSEFLFYQL